MRRPSEPARGVVAQGTVCAVYGDKSQPTTYRLTHGDPKQGCSLSREVLERSRPRTDSAFRLAGYRCRERSLIDSIQSDKTSS